MVKTSLSLGCLFFLLLAVFAKDTRGGVVELEKSFRIQKCLSTQQAETLCVRDSVCHKNAIATWPPNKDGHFKLTEPLLKYTHTDSAVMLSGLSFLPCRSLKVQAFTVYLTLFFSLSFSFLMEKEESKMKSIFNVYRGAQLNSLQSAETILNKLIFNEQPLCMRAK